MFEIYYKSYSEKKTCFSRTNFDLEINFVHVIHDTDHWEDKMLKVFVKSEKKLTSLFKIFSMPYKKIFGKVYVKVLQKF